VWDVETTGTAPLVSVIIPAFRAAESIATTLDSVLAQTFEDWEIIVVNDGSPDSDALETALEPYRDRINYLRQENQGPGGARNTGILAARGRYVALLDADDMWAPEHLAAQLAVLESDPSMDMVYADARIVGDVPEAGRTVMELCPSAGEVTFERLVTRQCTVHICVSVCRREALLRAGLFDPAFRGTEDIDMWLRIARQGGRIAYQRRVLGCYRRHAGSLSANRVSMLEGFLAVLAKAARDPDLTAAQREVLERQRAVERTSLELEKGRNAFLAGDTEAAVGHLMQVNAQHKSLKLATVLMLLRVAPGFLRALYQWRDRHAYKLKIQS
jgi:cellulose synthase/poly-beta-1,6-N-acetylglucosamine synthase-like glycosyltransferase